MSEKSKLISRLLKDVDARTTYIKAKLSVLVPSQIKSLRLRFNMPRQADLAKAAKLHQSRISMFETPGAANVTLETLARLAAALEVGLVVKFAPFSEMLRWENEFSQDAFNVTRLDQDVEFLSPTASVQEGMPPADVTKSRYEIGSSSFQTTPFPVMTSGRASA